MKKKSKNSFKNVDDFYTFITNYTYRDSIHDSYDELTRDLRALSWAKDLLYMLIWRLYKSKKLSKKDLQKIFYSVPK